MFSPGSPKDPPPQSDRKRKRNSNDPDTEPEPAKRSKGDPTEGLSTNSNEGNLEPTIGSDERAPTLLESKEKSPDFLLPILTLRAQLESVLNLLPKSSPITSVWGKLYQQFPASTITSLTGNSFTIGGSRSSNICLPETGVDIVCRLQYKGGKVWIEAQSPGIISINGKPFSGVLALKYGDEITLQFPQSQVYSYIYLEHKESSKDLLTSHRLSYKLKHKGSKHNWIPPSSNATTSTTSTTTTSTQSTGTPDSIPSLASNTFLPTTDDLLSLSAPPVITRPPSSTSLPPSTSMLSDGIQAGASSEEDDGLLSPVLHHLDTKHSIEAQRIFLEKLTSHVLPPKVTAEFSFDKFPYPYLDGALKRILVNSAYLFLRRPEYEGYTRDIPTLSRRILLYGPAGTQLYQEALAKALAHHFQANLFILDDNIALERYNNNANSSNTHSVSTTSDTEEDKYHANLSKNDTTNSETNAPKATATAVDVSNLPNPATSTTTTAATATATTTTTSTTAPTAPAKMNRYSSTTSTGTAPASSSGTSAASSRLTTCKRGDTVRYIWNNSHARPSRLYRSGSASATSTTSAPSTTATSTSGSHTASSASASSLSRVLGGGSSTGGSGENTLERTRGPPPGAKGVVVVTLDDNPSKVGVCFERPFPGGSSLGGLCEEGRGFFVDVADLRVGAGEVEEDISSSIMSSVFSVVQKHEPIILFIKDLENLCTSNYERYTIFKREMDKLQGRVLVLACM